jgi:hypothetical protein
MFDWFRKKRQPTKKTVTMKDDFCDELEESLWEIKEEFDLNTEEIEKVVIEKRHNVDYMNECLKSKK